MTVDEVREAGYPVVAVRNPSDDGYVDVYFCTATPDDSKEDLLEAVICLLHTALDEAYDRLKTLKEGL